jgi:AcrR family transcriptional regulator
MSRHYETTEVRRQQIAEAALHLLAEEGLGAFTTRAIAARVGLTDGTLFRHFKGKDEIVLAALAELEARMFAHDAPLEPADALAQLEAFFRHRARFVGEHGSVGRLLFSDQLIHVAKGDGRRVVAGWRERNLARLSACVGALPPRRLGALAPRDLMMIVHGLILSFAVRATLSDDLHLSESIDQTWQLIADRLLA